jgi:3-phenylpropionate/trans-cinnamate dioxygenase ferredoxin subunit
MAELVEALQKADLQEGSMQAVKVGGKELLMAKVGDSYYAADNLCPHLKALLSNGTLKGTVVTCPSHFSQFDLKDGSVVRWTNWSGFKLALSKLFRKPRPLNTYRVQLDGERVLVEL